MNSLPALFDQCHERCNGAERTEKACCVLLVCKVSV